MGRICVTGGSALYGETTVQGSKNAALPLMAASVLHRGVTILHNCPQIRDVSCMCGLLEGLGCRIRRSGHTVCMDASELSGAAVNPELAGQMRASVLLMGSLLGRLGEARLPFPGGCVIGSRPIDYHLELMRQLGADLREEEGNLSLKTRKLTGTELRLAFPSVGATENGILAAVLAHGTTILRGCAQEPEIRELCAFLKTMGAEIADAGSTIRIKGVKTLHDIEYTLMPDRIAAGTYLLAAAGTCGCITLRQAPAGQLGSLEEILCRMGVSLTCRPEESGHGKQPAAGFDRKNPDFGRFCSITADCRRQNVVPVRIATAPYPGFPTDLQSPLMAVLTVGAGRESILRETMFEARFHAAEELKKMGALIQVQKNQARIRGVETLQGMTVTARELRGGAALVLAGLMAGGVTTVEKTGFIQRGYEDLCRDLRELGGSLEETP